MDLMVWTVFLAKRLEAVVTEGDLRTSILTNPRHNVVPESSGISERFPEAIDLVWAEWISVDSAKGIGLNLTDGETHRLHDPNSSFLGYVHVLC